ncbi:hypothetical protein HNY73_000068 [Argiope bruennichi]|uniref:Uncharacterized protein n=1 Tax=Argiope bruennichi TaxID=94029 RepID=A0A8T0G0T2_ARGBR|nr:hypothetical protein HNY73_000068 [Argiope bruennichi]
MLAEQSKREESNANATIIWMKAELQMQYCKFTGHCICERETFASRREGSGKNAGFHLLPDKERRRSSCKILRSFGSLKTVEQRNLVERSTENSCALSLPGVGDT